MRIHRLVRETLVPAPLPKVFEFFSQAENLDSLTPPSLRFEILTPQPIHIQAGTIIDYRLRLLGVRFYWQTEITVWEPGVRFVDVQRKGPYLLWEHEHTFAERGPDTLMVDSLRYAVPGGLFEPLLTAAFVRRQVEGIFSFRAVALNRVFSGRLETAPRL